MNIITISREFGSGGRELGKRMADILGYDYYDREIIEKISERHGLDENYVEGFMETGLWRTVPLTFRRTLGSMAHMYTLSAELLAEQTRIIKNIASTGKNAIIIGRNADVILEEYNPLKIFVYADMESKINRCIERSAESEKNSRRDLARKLKEIDTSRAKTKELISSESWGDKLCYDLMVNTTDVDIADLASLISDFANKWFEKNLE